MQRVQHLAHSFVNTLRVRYPSLHFESIQKFPEGERIYAVTVSGSFSEGEKIKIREDASELAAELQQKNRYLLLLKFLSNR